MTGFQRVSSSLTLNCPGLGPCATPSLTSPRGEAGLLEVVVLDLTVPSISHLLSCAEKTPFKTQQQNQPTPYSSHPLPPTASRSPHSEGLIKRP